MRLINNISNGAPGFSLPGLLVAIVCAVITFFVLLTLGQVIVTILQAVAPLVLGLIALVVVLWLFFALFGR